MLTARFTINAHLEGVSDVNIECKTLQSDYGTWSVLCVGDMAIFADLDQLRRIRDAINGHIATANNEVKVAS